MVVLDSFEMVQEAVESSANLVGEMITLLVETVEIAVASSVDCKAMGALVKVAMVMVYVTVFVCFEQAMLELNALYAGQTVLELDLYVVGEERAHKNFLVALEANYEPDAAVEPAVGGD